MLEMDFKRTPVQKHREVYAEEYNKYMKTYMANYRENKPEKCVKSKEKVRIRNYLNRQAFFFFRDIDPTLFS
jgi:hypothetical protein